MKQQKQRRSTRVKKLSPDDVSKLPLGTDVTELYVNIEPTGVEIPYKGKRWPFVLRRLTWSEKKGLLSQSVYVNEDGTRQVDMGTFTRLALEAAVVSSPFPKSELLRLDPDLVDVLEAYIPDITVTTIDEDEEQTKN